jgi:hypothetical protein
MSRYSYFSDSDGMSLCSKITFYFQEVLSCIGGVQALFPILDTVVQNDLANHLLAGPLLSPDSDKPEVDGWEVLPSSSYAG